MALPSCLIAVDVQAGFIAPATASIPLAIREFCERNPIEHRIFTRFVNPGNGGSFVDSGVPPVWWTGCFAGL